MSWVSAVWSGVKVLFGVGTGTDGGQGKDIVQETADIYSNYHPGVKDAHDMVAEDAKQSEQNVNDARAMQGPQGGVSAFDVFVNGLNRLPRPLFSLWAFGTLVAATFGLISSTGFQNLDPFSQKLILTIVEFFFGIRVVSQDVPALIKTLRNK